MLTKEKGVISGSDIYFFTASALAKNIFIHLFTCGDFHCDTQYRVDRENYHNYFLAYVNYGVFGFETSGKSYEAKEGDIVILDCHTPHSYYAIKNMEIIWVHFDGKVTEDFFNVITKNQGYVFQNNSSYSFVPEMKKLLSECRNNQMLIESDLSWRIYKILCEFITKPFLEYPSVKNDAVSILLNFIKYNYNKEISLKDMANAAQLSPYHLSRVFKKHMSYSPYEFLIITRIDNAKHLLKTTDFLIKEIAYKVGFGSEINFTNSFTARVGLSPQKFRNFPL